MVMENGVNMHENFKLGFVEDFDLFFRKFCTFAKIVKVGQAQQYYLIFRFLDKKSFRIVQGILRKYKRNTSEVQKKYIGNAKEIQQKYKRNTTRQRVFNATAVKW